MWPSGHGPGSSRGGRGELRSVPQWDRADNTLTWVLLSQGKCSYDERPALWGQICGGLNEGMWKATNTPGSVSPPCSQGDVR